MLSMLPTSTDGFREGGYIISAHNNPFRYPRHAYISTSLVLQLLVGGVGRTVACELEIEYLHEKDSTSPDFSSRYTWWHKAMLPRLYVISLGRLCEYRRIFDLATITLALHSLRYFCTAILPLPVPLPWLH